MSNQKKGMLGSVSYVMFIMIASRLLALVSTQVYISTFGTVGDINIYSYAITIPNTIFTCFGTALSTVVIPIYAGHLANGNRDKAKKFADNIITISTVFTLILVLIGCGLSFVLPKMTEFKTGHEYTFAVKALMTMMPVMLFTGLNYILQGILQSDGHYGFPAFVSVPSSLVVIGYVFLFADKYGVSGLLVVTFIGLALQALILIPPTIAAGYRYHVSFDLRDEDIRSAGKMTLPVLLGVSAYQLNMFYNTTMIANFKNMTTLLTYVQNLVLYMVLAFVYSITAVLYPKLTSFAASGHMDEYKQTLSDTLNAVIFLLCPMTFGLVAVRTTLLDVIAGWGKFTLADVENASRIMLMYAIGILGIGMKEIFDRAFYALKDTKVPAINGFIIMAVNILLSLVLIRFIGAYGIPLAYSIASLTGFFVLWVWLVKKIGAFGKDILSGLVKCLLSGAVMLFSVWYLSGILQNVVGNITLLQKIICLGIEVCVGVVVYLVLSLILRQSVVMNFLHKKQKSESVI